MAFPNISDILATTIESRSRRIADNVTKNNAVLAKLSQSGKVRTFSGGHKILEELSFAENGNAQWFSGYDVLNVAPQDVITAAEYPIKQAACAVTISGLEQLQNAGREGLIDLMESRLAVAEASMANLVSVGLYSDGSGTGGKQITGLNAAVPVTPATGTYGNIDRATWTFWRPKVDTGVTADNILTKLNTMWASLVRGTDQPDLIIMDATHWGYYIAKLQPQLQFTDPARATMGFPSVRYMYADIVLDGGIGGACPTATTFMLNSKYLRYRPHAQRNMVPLSPNRRYAINQDAEVQLIGLACNLTASGCQFHGRLTA